MAAMRAQRSHALVQYHGCGALGNLAANADNQVTIAAAGGIKDVLEAMQVHKGNSEIEDLACRALHRLGQSADVNVSKALLESVPAVKAATSKDCERSGQKMIDRLMQSEVVAEVLEEGQRALKKREAEAEDNKSASLWKLSATGLAIWVCYRFIQAREVPADRMQPAANAEAQADAHRITAAARAEAKRITAAAQEAAERR